ncbi:TIGR01777 family oxidoreductase [Nocardioides jensenii]|uniref:TIGR01777 family oxidoreductase n=1 Tax=Nocardioides jensenii TaxID=1843 RepID=UPI000834C868|nr:TIGR01777 family oxidoreductase [Nocardioides jensenii]
MDVVIAGASGFLGSHLTQRLRDRGHSVTRLVRHPARTGDESQWDPYAGRLDQSVLDAADVVINLAGSPLLGNPHSKKWADDLVRSRVTTTRVLADAVARSQGEGRPTAFLAGNGISFYGDHGDCVVTEDTEPVGEAFLTGVTQLWEEATSPAVAAGARVCILRTAPVMDARSAPLKQMRLPFKLGLGARLGPGNQFFPMISLRDWLGAVVHLTESPDASGPHNLCCPVSPTNADFTQALAKALGSRAFVAVPAFVLDKAAGRMSPELLGSVHAEPAALLAEGFEFADNDVRDVLASGLHH